MDKKSSKLPKEKRGISLKKMNYLTCVVIIIIAALTLVSTYVSASRYAGLRTTTLNYIDQQQIAELLRDGSDYLTEEVRAFTVTGDRARLDNYFIEANATRRRDRAIDTLKGEIGGTASYSSLTEAMNASLKLMEREYYAMRLAIEARGYDLSEYPAQIQDVVLDESDRALSADKMALKAEEMVFDEEYRWYKDKIYGELQNCLTALAETTEENVEKSFEQLSGMFVVQHILMIALVAVTVLVIITTSIQVISPLVGAIPKIKEELPLSVQGAYEYKYLAKTYNKMFEANKRQKKMLAYEAMHDELTGLFNRNGLEKMRQKIDIETSAFILIDIDDFKLINDTNGHLSGDEALKHVTEEIEKSFRSEDIIARIGGDEFLVLIDNVSDTENLRNTISAKTASINKSLEKWKKDLPNLSVSFGVAFGQKGADFTTMEQNADTALYEAKNSGKKKCVFFK